MIYQGLLRSFAGGEITPELAGRLDLVKNQTGLKLAENFITTPHGPATRRPGLEFCNVARGGSDSVRIFPFVFSATDSAVLEFGANYIRVFVNGALVVDSTLSITGVSKANPGVLTYTGTDPTNGDWFQLTGIGGMTELNGRWVQVSNVNASTNTFELQDVHGASINTLGYTTYTSGGQADRALKITTTYDGGQLATLNIAQDADVVTLAHPDHPTRELARTSSTTWTLTDVTFSPGISAPGAPSVVATVATATNLSPHTYCVTAVMDDGITESLASGSTTVSNNLTLAGNYNTITWLAVSGASRYRVYKRKGGGFGYIGQTTSLSTVDDNITPDTSQSPPEDIIALNTGTDDYPRAVAHHEQRRWFAGTNDKPQVLFASRTGTSSNLSSSIPSRDADAMELRVAAMQNNQIVHLVPLSDLIAFTGGGEFRVFSDGAPAVTPTSVSIKGQGYSGAAAEVQPVTTTNSALFVQAQGSRVRELSYNWETNLYRSSDVSLMAPHRFNGYSVVQLAYTRAPDPILWAVRGDGVLLGMTHVPDQQVYGWHAHVTDGYFESVCVIPEAGEDVAYVVVRRVLNNVSTRTIERFRTRFFTELQEAFFVDCGLTYVATGVTSTIGGLWHLEGLEVDILSAGAVEPRQTVTGGQITLAAEVDAGAEVHIGLPYTSTLETLPLSIEGAPALGQGRPKNVNKVHLRVASTSLVKAGPDVDHLVSYPSRSVTQDMGTPPALRTGEISLTVSPNWNNDAGVVVVQDAPLPLTVLSMTLEVAIGG